MAFLCLSLSPLSLAIAKEGKILVTASALKDLLLVCALVLKTAADACEALVHRLTLPKPPDLPPIPTRNATNPSSSARSLRKVREHPMYYSIEGQGTLLPEFICSDVYKAFQCK